MRIGYRIGTVQRKRRQKTCKVVRDQPESDVFATHTYRRPHKISFMFMWNAGLYSVPG